MLGPHYLLKESFCRGNFALGAEHKLNGLAFFVHGSVQILARLPDLEVRLIYPIRRAAHLQMRADAFIDLRGISLNQRNTAE